MNLRKCCEAISHVVFLSEGGPIGPLGPIGLNSRIKLDAAERVCMTRRLSLFTRLLFYLSLLPALVVPDFASPSSGL